MNSRLRVRLIRERANSWMTDNIHPRVDCQDLTELVKVKTPIKRTWLTSKDVAPKKFQPTT